MNERELMMALLAHVERERTVSIPQVSKLLGADEETVWRLLEQLVFCYDAVSLRLELGEHHATMLDAEGEQLLRLTADETAALVDALTSHGFSPDDELVEKLLAAKGFAAQAEELPNSSVGTLGRGVDAGLFETLSAACADEGRHLLELDYQKDGAERATTRTVEPAFIRSHDDHSFLEAYDLGADGWRTFRIDRIRHARMLDERFTPRAFPESENAHEAIVSFADGQLPDWPGIRKSRTCEDGSIEAKLPWYGSLWLPKRIVATHGRARAIAPEELVDKTRSYARSLLDS